MIRRATVADRDQLVELAAAFLAEAGYPDAAQQAGASVSRVLTAGAAGGTGDDGTALVIDTDGRLDGFFGFLVGPHPITGQRTAFELGWYVRPDARRGTQGVRLLREAQAAATRLGAEVLQVSVLEDRLGAFLERVGYERREITYIRPLSP